jgi:hypothetical protein
VLDTASMTTSSEEGADDNRIPTTRQTTTQA